MKITIERRDALAALALVTPVAQRASTIPILQMAKITAGADALSITACNLDMAITASIPARVAEGRGETLCISCDRLNQIVRALAEGADLTLTAPPEWATKARLTAGRSRFELGRLDPQDFPEIAMGQATARLTFTAETLARLFRLGSQSVATGKGDGRAYMYAVHLESQGALLHCSSTNGKKMHRITGLCEDNALPRGAMLSKPFVDLAIAALSRMEADDIVDLSLTDNLARLVAGATCITSKLLDGSYPVISRVIPVDPPNVMTVDYDIFSGALARVMTMEDPTEASSVIMEITATGAMIAVRSPIEGCSGEESFDVQWTGADTRIAVNGRWLREVIAEIKTEAMTVSMHGAGDPLLIMETGTPDWLALLVPQRV